MSNKLKLVQKWGYSEICMYISVNLVGNVNLISIVSDN